MQPAGFSSWTELFEAFRQIGGVVDNVTVKTVDGIRGLHAAVPSLPYRIFTPKRALVPVKDLELRDGFIRIVEGSACPPDVRAFFERYQAFTSWGGGGEADTAAYLHQLRTLPDDVKAALKKHLDYTVPAQEPTPQEVLETFLAQRRIDVDGGEVVMPVMELVNHSSKANGFDISNGDVAVSGTGPGEIHVRYKTSDSWSMFRHYGFPSLERWAFSQGFEVSSRNGGGRISVGTRVRERIILPNSMPAPKVERKPTGVDISFLILGDRVDPTSPLRVFNSHVRPHMKANAAEFFESLLHLNRTKFLAVLAACEGHDGKIIHDLRRVCRLQLETLNCSFVGAWV